MFRNLVFINCRSSSVLVYAFLVVQVLDLNLAFFFLGFLLVLVQELTISGL